ncbi:amidohydrolase family protein [Pseudactinotalea sp. Z1739]|uniref:amidohydrolase family protein n=1 Tax=Pseudactinotalea sp. Z1739 TaxID=3413028 RepID=UPI003C7E2F8C
MALIVDAHAHVFAASDQDPRQTNELVPADRYATIEDYRDRLNAAGVDKAVLVPLDEHDAYVAAQLALHPDRFRAIAVASAADLGRTGDDPVDHLRTRRETFPFAGIRTMWLGEPGTPLADSPIRPMLAYMETEGLILWSYLPPDQAPLLTEVGELYPDLRVVLNHMGFTPHDMQVDRHSRPWFATGLTPQRRAEVEALARFDSVHLMFSGHYALSHQPHPYPEVHEAGAALVAAFGPERTLWGSDWPWIDQEPGYPATYEIVNLALPDLSHGERAMIRGGTAQRLFDFSA